MPPAARRLSRRHLCRLRQPGALPELVADPNERVDRLVDLFVRAEFSPHVVDAAMKDEAIDALVRVRDELRESAGLGEPAEVPA